MFDRSLRASTFAGYRARPQHQRNTFPLMQSFFRRRCTFVKDSVLLSRGGLSGSLVRPNLDRARKYHRQKEGTLHDRNRTSSTRVRGGSLLKNEALFRSVPRLRGYSLWRTSSNGLVSAEFERFAAGINGCNDCNDA